MAKQHHQPLEEEFETGMFPFDAMRRQAHEHPVQSVIVFGMGVGLGLALVSIVLAAKVYEELVKESS